jgi:hypothetical protein
LACAWDPHTGKTPIEKPQIDLAGQPPQWSAQIDDFLQRRP